MRKIPKPSPTSSPLLFEFGSEPLQETLTAVGVLEDGIAKAPMHEVFCKSFLQNWVRDENPYGVVSFIHFNLRDADPL